MGRRTDGECGNNHLLVRLCVIYRTIICSISERWEDRRRKEKDGLDGSNNTDRGINVGWRRDSNVRKCIGELNSKGRQRKKRKL